MMKPLFSVILVNYNGRDFILDCIGSVLKSTYPNFEIILVDNASCDDSINLIEQRFSKEQRLKIIKNEKNLHFAEGNNVGIKNSKGDFVILLNNDTEVETNWLEEIEFVMREPSIGASQPKILCHDNHGIIDNAGNYFDALGYTHGRGHLEKDTYQYEKIEDIFFAAGTAMVIRSSILKEVGLLDSQYLIYAEDVDLSWRIRLKGYRIVYIPKSLVYHKGSKTVLKFPGKITTTMLSRKNRLATLIKNYGFARLCKNLALILILYVLIFFKEMLLDRNPKLAFTSLSAILWNIKKLPYLLRERWIVQKNIRVLSDKEIAKSMHRKSILVEQYLLPSIRLTKTNHGYG